MTNKKPKAKVIGQDGNVFGLIGICSSALKKAGLHTEAKEMTSKVFNAKSYDDALVIMGEYCELC